MGAHIRMFLAGGGVAAGAAGNLLAIVGLPWAHYGSITIHLDRFPGWWWHVAAVAGLYGTAVWTLLSPAARRRLPIVSSAAAGLAAVGSALALAVRYDESSLFFDQWVPAIMPVPGAGSALATLSVLVCLTAVGSCWPRRVDGPAPLRPRRADLDGGSGAAGAGRPERV